MSEHEGCSASGCVRPRHARGFCKMHYQRLTKHGDAEWTPPRERSPEERFWAMVAPTGFCWEWVGHVSRAGYGYFTPKMGESPLSAHRYAYELLVGPIPAGLVIDHLCRNRACVNPDHLEAVSGRENVLRGHGITAQLARQTHCKRGHEFTPENTKLIPRGRQCRACQRLSSHRSNMKRRHGIVVNN